MKELIKMLFLNITIQEFLDKIRLAFKNELTDKFQLILNKKRYSLVLFIKDKQDNFLLVSRNKIKDLPNKNNFFKTEDLILLDRIDAPIASRAILPDSPFKTEGIENMKILDITYLGEAFEDGEKEEVDKAVMTCLLLEVDGEFPSNLLTISKAQICVLNDKKLTKKVIILKDFLLK